jgi:phospholipase/carboxylesterase
MNGRKPPQTVRPRGTSPDRARPPRHPLPLGADAARLFIPQGYEPGYAYPLLVWLPDPADARFDLARTMSRVSLRNFVAVQPSAAADGIEEAVWRSVDSVRQRLAIHGERIFLVGQGAGGTEAFRSACRHPDAFAGAVSLAGPFPLEEPLFARLDRVRRLPMLLCCRRDTDAESARRTDRTLRLFHAAGGTLALRIYPERGAVSRAILADVNRWLMDEICGTTRAVPSACGS